MVEKAATRKGKRESVKIRTVTGIAAGLAAIYLGSRFLPAYGAGDAKPIGGIPCDREEHLNFHIHAHLDIFVDGQPHAVPESIGIIPRTCLYWLHTHDRSGIIHVEALQAWTFTLGQFFDIWKATAKGVPASKEKPKVFVNGRRVSVGLEQVEITPLSEIAVIYGKEPSVIPSSYNFPQTYLVPSRPQGAARKAP